MLKIFVKHIANTDYHNNFMLLFFKEEIKKTGIDFLNEEESKHCIRVLRLERGATLFLTNGQGALAQVRITNANPKKCEIETIDYQFIKKEKGFYTHLAIAPTKNADRMEWLVEKCVEIGIDEISFVLTKHTERSYFNIERIEKKAIAALKQSLQTWLPILNPPCSFEDFMQKLEGKTTSDTQKFIAYVDEQNTQSLAKTAKPNQHYCVLIGPEGDFSKEELEIAIQGGFQKVSLGKNRLRTETAGLFACCALTLANE